MLLKSIHGAFSDHYLDLLLLWRSAWLGRLWTSSVLDDLSLLETFTQETQAG